MPLWLLDHWDSVIDSDARSETEAPAEQVDQQAFDPKPILSRTLPHSLQWPAVTCRCPRYLFRGPSNKNYSILGSILRSPNSRKALPAHVADACYAHALQETFVVKGPIADLAIGLQAYFVQRPPKPATNLF